MHRRWLAFAFLSALAIVGAPSCAETLDGDDGDGDGDGGSGGGDGPKSCNDYLDATDPTIEVKFVNDGTEEIYISTPCDVPNRPEFFLSGVNIDPDCELGGTCGDLRSEDKVVTCPSQPCERGDFIKIEAGQTYTFPWVATQLELAEMPESCYAESKQDLVASQCWRRVALEEGEYTVSGMYYRRIDLMNGQECPCTLTVQPGVCIVDVNTCTAVGANPDLTPVDVNLPSDGEIVFHIP